MKAPIFHRRFGIPVFAASLVAGWWVTGEISRLAFSGRHGFSMTSAEPGPRADGKGSQDSARNKALSQIAPSSGLPDDFIHLSTISDTRTLEAAWAEAEHWMAQDILTRRWSELDPQSGIRWFLHGGDTAAGPDERAASMILDHWAKRDPAAALNYLEGLTRTDFPDDFAYCVVRLINGMLEKDPAAALASWHRAGAPARQAMVEAVFVHLFTNDPTEALREMANAPFDDRRKAWELIGYVKDPGGLIRSLLARPDLDCPTGDFGSIFKSLAGKDPQAAKALAESVPPGPRRAAACRAVLEKLVEDDPAVALTWMEEHAPNNENRSLVYSALSETDPQRALELFRQSQAPLSGEVRSTLQTMADENWASARALADSQPGGLRKKEMIAVMVSGLIEGGESGLPAQLDKLGGLLSGSGLKPEDLQGLWFRLNFDDTPKVAAWLDAQPADVRELLLPGLFDIYRHRDPAEAGDWLLRQAPGEARTSAIASHVFQLAVSDPTAAAAFGLNLPPGPEQDCAILNTAAAWQRNDPAAAQRWLESLPESGGRKQALEHLRASRKPGN